ncbi:hypothetical protein BGW80DRAFT_1438825 [Lactifluus volemus]|nr:hypothetical protein BGW80DRAFT_1438825 [Lactifluus volemus]
MGSKKRSLEDATSPKAKKSKVVEGSADKKEKKPKAKLDKPLQHTSNLVPEEIDFPRGGGTTCTPQEVKAIRAEAIKEADEELFKMKSSRKKSDTKGKGKAIDGGRKETNAIRIEHLNYKRITVGMKILAQVVSIGPLALVVSLPNQLYGHVPITQISSELTCSLESMDVDDKPPPDDNDGDDDDENDDEVYLRCVVIDSHAAGRAKDEAEKASRRVELSLIPEQVNKGVVKTDLKSGFVNHVRSVKSIEDHGYILNLGIPEVSGFLSFKDATKALKSSSKLPNGRTCNVTIVPASIKSSHLTEITNVTSILPGELVQCLVTSVSFVGLNVQVLGYFDGTIDEYHLPPGDPTDNFKAGKKVKARVLYEIPGTSPPRFALSLASHIISLERRTINAEDDEHVANLDEAYPIGTILEAVKVVRVEAERGLLVDVQENVQGFVHISQTSDDYVPSLSASSGAWKVGASRRARVTGYYPFDGILQLSMRTSVLEQKFLKVSDVQVGVLLKGIVKKLTDSALFVSISGSVDGVIFPNHYADIILKHPQKRFKEGSNIKCRVLVVDPERKRVALTAKKTLVESDLPLISHFEHAQVGMVTHAVIFKIMEKRLLVEFFNNVKDFVSENLVGPLTDSFVVGKPVKVRIISVDAEMGNITASIRCAAPSFDINVADISAVEIANHRNLSVSQLRTSLKIGEELDELVVVTRNPEKGIVIVANRPKTKPALEHKQVLTMETVEIGQIVGGRVLRHSHNGTVIKFSGKITGSLHPTDSSDDYETGIPYPALDSIIKAAVISIDKDKKQLVVSTRESRTLSEDHPPIVDREINGIEDLKVGETVRGFVKGIPEHGLFVTLGRTIDARVQIKELFDEFVKEWKPRFQLNQLVKGRVLSVDTVNRKVELSFRSGNPSKLTGPTRSLSDFQAGQKIQGRVKKIEDYGLFIEIEGTKVSGLCHKSELSDNKDADTTLALRSFREGDMVKAVVCSVDLDKRRISFSLKPFKQMDDASSEDQGPLGVIEDVEMSSVGDDNAAASDDDKGHDSDIEPMVVDVDAGIQSLNLKQLDPPALSSARPAPTFKIQGGFRWTGDIPQEHTDGPESSEDSDDDGQQHNKKKRKKKKQVELDLTADMQAKTPESTSDFDRYMSFQLQLAEIEKAREIAKRALATINFREEKERLNVWIALMNLENDAARHCEPKTVHLRLASILEQSEKHEKAEEQYKRTCKKFGQSSKHYLKRGEVEQARMLLPRSLQSLEKRKHLKTISKFAQLEYKLGEPERGKTLFEGIVDSHPKRWDLWYIYIDMEASQNDMQSIRNLFDRVFVQKMTSHKAKAFFKKWLALEKRIGDEEGAETVKAKAIEWTRRAAAHSTGGEE